MKYCRSKSRSNQDWIGPRHVKIMSKLSIWYCLSKSKKNRKKHQKKTENESPQRIWTVLVDLSFHDGFSSLDCRWIAGTYFVLVVLGKQDVLTCTYIISTNCNKCHTNRQYSSAIPALPERARQVVQSRQLVLVWRASCLDNFETQNTLSPRDCYCKICFEENYGFFWVFAQTWFLLPIYWALLYSCFFGAEIQSDSSCFDIVA